LGIFTKPFSTLNGKLAGLAKTSSVATAQAHQRLARGVWVSFQEDMGTELAISGGSEGLGLDLKTIGRSDWLSLSFTVPVSDLRQGRFVALIVKTQSAGFISYRPSMRYVQSSGEFQDQFGRDYIVSAGGEDEQLSFLRIDKVLLGQASRTEMHLFLQGTKFQMSLPHIELALIP